MIGLFSQQTPPALPPKSPAVTDAQVWPGPSAVLALCMQAVLKGDARMMGDKDSWLLVREILLFLWIPTGTWFNVGACIATMSLLVWWDCAAPGFYSRWSLVLTSPLKPLAIGFCQKLH